MYCPNENVYLYLYPDEQVCSEGLETLQRNMEAMRAQMPESSSPD
jgi:hypothetical protein